MVLAYNTINMARERVMSIVLDPIRREASLALDQIRLKDEKRRREIMDKPGCSPCDRPAVDPTYFETYKQYQLKERSVGDPTTLILVDEADRLHMNSLEQIRSIFDEGEVRSGAHRYAGYRKANRSLSSVLFTHPIRS